MDTREERTTGQRNEKERGEGETHSKRLLGNSTTTVLPPYAKYPSSSPRRTLAPFCAVHRMLPTCSFAFS